MITYHRNRFAEAILPQKGDEGAEHPLLRELIEIALEDLIHNLERKKQDNNLSFEAYMAISNLFDSICLVINFHSFNN